MPFLRCPNCDDLQQPPPELNGLAWDCSKCGAEFTVTEPPRLRRRPPVRPSPSTSIAPRVLPTAKRIEPQKETEPSPTPTGVPQLAVPCPKCSAVTPQAAYPGASLWRFVCRKCKGTITVQRVVVRAKRSRLTRYSKFHAIRNYSVRVLDPDKSESLIEFSTSDVYDIEMRAKDEVHFLFYNGTVGVVENVTIGRRTVLNTFPDPPPPPEPFRLPDLEFLRPVAYVIAGLAIFGFLGCCVLGMIGLATNSKQRR